MALFRQRDLIDTFDDLLDRELALVAKGKFQELARLVPEKESLIQKITAGDVDRNRLQQLRDKAERNQRILDATKQGVKAALDRVEQIFTGQIELNVYDSGGVKVDSATETSTFKKRA